MYKRTNGNNNKKKKFLSNFPYCLLTLLYSIYEKKAKLITY